MANTQGPIKGIVTYEPRIGQNTQGKLAVNFPVLVPHSHEEGRGNWVPDEPERYDVALWQPDRLYGEKAKEWAESVKAGLPKGLRVQVFGQIGKSDTVNYSDGTSAVVTKVSAWSAGPDFKFGGVEFQMAQVAERQAAAAARQDSYVQDRAVSAAPDTGLAGIGL